MSSISRYKDEFEKIDTLGFLGSDRNIGAWALRYARVPVINQRLDGFKEYFSNYLLPTVGHKS